MHGYNSFLYIILIFFFSPLTFSLFPWLSLQPIISTTNNPTPPTTHRPTTANRPTTTTQHYQPHTDPPPQTDPPSQLSTANHHHRNLAPPITTTSTRTHCKINQNKTNPHTNTPTETKRVFLWTCGCGLVFGSIGTMLVDRGSMLVDRCLRLWGRKGEAISTERRRGRGKFNYRGIDVNVEREFQMD